MMAAVTGVLLAIQTAGDPENATTLSRQFLAIDFVAYLCLALLCVRCQFHIDSAHPKTLELVDKSSFRPSILRSIEKDAMARFKNRQILDDVFRGEIFYRETLFRICFRGLLLLTIVLALTVILWAFDVEIVRSIRFWLCAQSPYTTCDMT